MRKVCVFTYSQLTLARVGQMLRPQLVKPHVNIGNSVALLTGSAIYKKSDRSIHPVTFTFINIDLIHYYCSYFYYHYLLHLLSRLGASVGVFSFYLDCLGSEIEFLTFGFLLTPRCTLTGRQGWSWLETQPLLVESVKINRGLFLAS